MKLTKYKYQGPDSGITVQAPAVKEGEKPETLDVLLRHDAIVALPADNEAVQSLKAQGYLIDPPTEDAAAAGEASGTATAAKAGKK